MRVVILSQWYPPEPAHKGAELAHKLIEDGHDVVVVTGFPNYPGGRLYDGYRIRFLQKETVQGVPVIRLPLYPSHNKSAVGRVANYVSFAVAGAVAAPWLVGGADVCYVYHPPGTVGLVALSLQAFRRIPYLLDVEDLWPDTLEATGMLPSTRARRLVGRWMSFLYKRARHIIVLSPGFKGRLEERGVPPEKVSVVYNWWLGGTERRSDLPAPIRAALTGRFNVVFAGNMGKAQALDAVLDAGSLLASSHPLVQLILVGDGVEAASLERSAADRGLTNIVFVSRMTPDEVATLLESADALLVHLRNDPLFSITIPSKTQAYLAIGKPIVMGVGGDAAALVAEADVGVTCDPENPESIAAAIGSLAEMSHQSREEMGQRGKRFYEKTMSIDRGVKRISALLERVAGVRTTSDQGAA